MTKYSDEFKLSVVKSYLNGDEGVSAVSQHYGVGHGTIREWVACYRLQGAAGLTKKFSHYSEEFKVSVLKHMWDNALSHRETAAHFNIRSRTCLRMWEKCYRNGGIDALISRRKGRPKAMSDPGNNKSPLPNDKKRTREELLAELKQLRMENAYLKKVEALVRAKRALKKRK